ncbi:hypothetical protein ASG27_19320 [Acidovorax sp. Leaf191]|nr:hypothetical protein ASG27_19320 [Acidovorax sp. Leaf191]
MVIPSSADQHGQRSLRDRPSVLRQISQPCCRLAHGDSLFISFVVAVSLLKGAQIAAHDRFEGVQNSCRSVFVLSSDTTLTGSLETCRKDVVVQCFIGIFEAHTHSKILMASSGQVLFDGQDVAGLDAALLGHWRPVEKTL